MSLIIGIILGAIFVLLLYIAICLKQISEICKYVSEDNKIINQKENDSTTKIVEEKKDQNELIINFNTDPISSESSSFTQTLTPDQIESIREKIQDKHILKINNQDHLRAICIHRDIHGHSTLDNDDISGMAKCKICGKRFNVVDNCSDQDIQNAVDNLIDILQTTKALYVDIPKDTAEYFYSIIPVLENIPILYKAAIENFNKHENTMSNWNGVRQNYNMPATPIISESMHMPIYMPSPNYSNNFGYYKHNPLELNKVE